MLEKDVLIKLLMTMTTDIESNKKKIQYHFGNINFKTVSKNQSLLHVFVDEKFDEEKCFLAIKTLLEMGVNPNHKDDFDYNFIQLALYTGYSEKFILKIAEEAFKYGLNPNHQDADKDTVIHTAIYSEDYFGGIEELLKLYISHGFDINITCEKGNNVVSAMMYMNQYIKDNGINMNLYTSDEIKRVKNICSTDIKQRIKESSSNLIGSINILKGQTNNMFNNKDKPLTNDKLSSRVEIKEEKQEPKVQENMQPKTSEISPSVLRELEKYGTILNSKHFTSSKAVGRDEEILRLMVSLAKEDSSPMLVGESGVGKSAIADELAYRISIGAVPKFLQGKIVLEINPETFASNTKYTGEFEAKVLDLMRLIEENDVIVLINEIHTIYGIGTTENNDRDFASIIKKYIDRKSLKVIGTTTKKEYSEYFSQDALKRRFDTINVEEPNNDLLYTILEKVMIDYVIKKGIQFKDENKMHLIIELLIEVTKPNYRKYDDKLCNPALAISIIDEAFATAVVFEDEYIEEHHFVKAIEWCERIYGTSKQKVIAKLQEKKEENNQRPIILQFKK